MPQHRATTTTPTRALRATRSRPRGCQTPPSGHPLGRTALPGWEVAVGTLAVGVLALGRWSDPAHAWRAILPVLPVLAFLSSVLVLAHRCADDGLFVAIGSRIAHAGRASPTRLAGLSLLAAAVVTAVLNLDATVVLLGPVLIAAAAQNGCSARPETWASVRLANSASTLLPVSNLTNLLAFSASGLTFIRFAWLMWPVWLAALAAEWVVLRLRFGPELSTATRPVAPDGHPPVPRLPLAVAAAVLAGFVLGSFWHLAPAWPAAIGATVLVVHALGRARTSPIRVVRSAGLPLAYLVACWSVVVAAVAASPAGHRVAGLLPAETGLLGLLATALLAMVVANVVNNIPATLLLVPLAAPLGSLAVLATLIGVNVGANLTYVGSLANVLWLRTVGADRVTAGQFHLLGFLTTPPIVVLCAATLWAWTALTGWA